LDFRVLSYVLGKCTTVVVVNWAEIGRSMKDWKFRVQSSLFRSICILSPLLWNFVIDTFLEIFKAHTAEVIAYADDGALIVTADDMDTAQHHMQTAIDKAQAWAEVVGL
jgi:hypothetical protein